MGLRETIQAAVASGLSAAGNILRPATYNRVGIPSYNATTGTVTATPTASTVSAMFYSFHKDEIDGTVIRPEDQKVLLGGPALGFTPTHNDTIEDEDGQAWVVKGVKKDPTAAVWILHVRKPG